MEELQTKLNKYEEQKEKLLLLKETDPEDEEVDQLIEDIDETIDLTKKLIEIKKSEEETKKKVKEQLKVGDLVEGRVKGGKLKWYVGTVENIEEVEMELSGMDQLVKEYTVKYLGYSNTSKLCYEKLNIRRYKTPDIKKFKRGTNVMAIYQEDGIFYDAVVDHVTNKNTVVVNFQNYNKKQETPFHFIRFKLTAEEKQIEDKRHKNQKKNFRQQQKNEIRDQKQQNWQSFMKSKKGSQAISSVKRPQTKTENLTGSIEYQPLKKKKFEQEARKEEEANQSD
eukprot:gene7949-12416_t